MLKRTEDTEVFSAAVKKARIARGWTQEQLADKSGLSSMQISKYERGGVMPQEGSVAKLNAALFPNGAAPKANATVVSNPKKHGKHHKHPEQLELAVSHLSDFTTEEITKELKRRGFGVNLTA